MGKSPVTQGREGTGHRETEGRLNGQTDSRDRRTVERTDSRDRRTHDISAMISQNSSTFDTYKVNKQPKDGNWSRKRPTRRTRTLMKQINEHD